MQKLQTERNALLLYALQNPPPHVTVTLPEGVNSVVELDLTHTPSPLAVYAAAAPGNPIEVLVNAPLKSKEPGADKKSGEMWGAYGSESPRRVKKFRFRWKELSNYFTSHLRGDSRVLCSSEETPPRTNVTPPGSERKVRPLCTCKAEPCLQEKRSVVQLSRCSSAHREPLPLEGGQEYTLATYLAPFLSPRGFHARNPLEKPDVPVVRLCPVVDSTLFPEFDEDEQKFLFYEHMLLATVDTYPSQHTWFNEEVSDTYRKAMCISSEEHVRCVRNVLREAVKPQKQSSGQIDIPTVQQLVATSSDSDFIQRMSRILGICFKHSEDPNRQKYPLSLRAFVYAGALSPLYRTDANGKAVLQEGEVSNAIAALRRKMEIPKDIEPFCHVHARLLSIDDTNDVERRGAFLKDLASSLHSMSKTTRLLGEEPLTPEIKYMLYILQETFGMSVMPMTLLGVIRSDCTLLAVSGLLFESCLALPIEFLSVYVQVDYRGLLPPVQSTNSFLLNLLVVFITCGVLRSFSNLELDFSSRTAPSNALAGIRRLGRTTRAYCEQVSQTIPHATALMLPAVIIVASHVLATCWGDTLHNEEGPPEFSKGIRAVLDLLLLYSSPDAENEVDISQVLSDGAINLTWITPLMGNHDRISRERISRKFRVAKAALKAGSLARKRALCHVEALTTEFDMLIAPPPLVPNADDVTRQRMAYVVEMLGDLISAIKGPFTWFNANTDTRSVQQCNYVQEYKDLLKFQRTVSSGFLSMEDVLERLNCLQHIHDQLNHMIASLHDDYQSVREVIGTPVMEFGGIIGPLSTQLDGGIASLCDTAAVAIVRVGLADTLFTKFMKTDMRLYKTLKSNKTAVLERRHLRREYPDVTMDVVLHQMELIFSSVRASVGHRMIVAEIWAKSILHFVVALYYVYFEESDERFFCPEDWEDILLDLQAVEAFIADLPLSPPLGSSSRKHCGAGDRTAAAAAVHCVLLFSSSIGGAC
uniref:Uncharacterized protein TCIL3000_8_5890 n=1 Tax=Trypanosoma congolense (strain IL3000) TaxID=1068625 RepID=G0USK2_TRYCI|nr:unnamed protein product [Trypanosoma congolense IL3000]